MTKSLNLNKGWLFDEAWWTDMFDGCEVLMHEDIGSHSVTLFTFNWSLEMGKYGVMPWIMGLFTIFLFLISFSIAFSMKLKSALVEWNSVIVATCCRAVLSGLIVGTCFAFPYCSYSVHNMIRKKYQHYLWMPLEIHLGCNKKSILQQEIGNNLENLNKRIMLIG